RDERDVESLGDLRRQLDAELREDITQDLAGRRGVRNDQVGLAESRVVVMVIDVEHERRAFEWLRLRADPGLVRAIDSDQHALAPETALEDAMRRLQRGQTLLLLLLGAEDADVDPRVPEVRRGLDSSDRHEADPGVFELAHRLGQHLADGHVDTAHPVAHGWYSTRVALHALALAAVAAWCFVTALAGGLVGLVLGNIRLPALLLISSSPAAGAGANIGVSGVAAATAAVTQVRAGRIHWRVFWWMAPPSVVGAILGGLVSGALPATALLVVIGILLLAFGIDLLRPRRQTRRREELDIPAAVVSGAVIGFLGGVVGLILGSLRMSALLRFVGEEPVRAIGTNLLLGVFVGAAGVVGHVPDGIDWAAFVVGAA